MASDLQKITFITQTLPDLHQLRGNYLKMILFLAHESIIGVRKVEPFIGINAIMWHWPTHEKRKYINLAKNCSTLCTILTILSSFDHTKHAKRFAEMAEIEYTGN